jgi:hypothetical protein
MGLANTGKNNGKLLQNTVPTIPEFALINDNT